MKKIKNILILAGGDSTRFWPLKDKTLFSFLGKPLLLYLVENLLKYGEKIVIVSHPSFLRKVTNLFAGRAEVIFQDPNLTGMAGAIISAKERVNGEVLILNASDIFNFDILSQFIDKIRDEKAKILLLAKKVKEYFPGGYLRLKNKRVVEIIEKPAPERTPSDMVKLVVDYFFDFQELVKILYQVKTTKDDQYEQGVNQLLKKHQQDNSYLVYNDYWHSLKYPWQVLLMMRYFLATLKNNEVRLGRNVRIGQYVKITGPTYIGDNTVIGDYVMIRESHIGSNCLIGGYSEVTRSYLDDGVYLHRNYVGDSVLGKNVLMGAGAVLANFRFDGRVIKNTGLVKLGSIIGEDSRIGVNGTILPGVKIGKNTFIGPAELIDKDIEDNKFVFKGKTVKNKSI